MNDIDFQAGQLIRERRKLKRLSQTQLGERVGLATGTISQYEKGKRQMDLLTFFKICHILDISHDEINSFVDNYLEKHK